MLKQFCDWLVSTPASEAIQNTFWMIPLIQSVHIVSIAITVSAVTLLHFRLLGLTGRDQSVPETARRYLPWIWTAVAILACSGLLLIVAEPPRELENPMFWTKMTLLLCALIFTALFQVMLKRDGFWERNRALSALIGIVSLLLWTGVVVAGRWIAYVVHS